MILVHSMASLWAPHKVSIGLLISNKTTATTLRASAISSQLLSASKPGLDCVTCTASDRYMQ